MKIQDVVSIFFECLLVASYTMLFFFVSFNLFAFLQIRFYLPWRDKKIIKSIEENLSTGFGAKGCTIIKIERLSIVGAELYFAEYDDKGDFDDTDGDSYYHWKNNKTAYYSFHYADRTGSEKSGTVKVWLSNSRFYKMEFRSNEQ